MSFIEVRWDWLAGEPCSHHDSHDAEGQPTGECCGAPSTHVIVWLDGTHRYSPCCEEHSTDIDESAPPHYVRNVHAPVLPPMSIGSDTWPGLAKLAEEAGELVQVIGKIAAYPDSPHPDGEGDLAARLGDELADVMAACEYVIAHNEEISPLKVRDRLLAKLERFNRWHEGEGVPGEPSYCAEHGVYGCNEAHDGA